MERYVEHAELRIHELAATVPFPRLRAFVGFPTDRSWGQTVGGNYFRGLHAVLHRTVHPLVRSVSDDDDGSWASTVGFNTRVRHRYVGGSSFGDNPGGPRRSRPAAHRKIHLPLRLHRGWRLDGWSRCCPPVQAGGFRSVPWPTRRSAGGLRRDASIPETFKLKPVVVSSCRPGWPGGQCVGLGGVVTAIAW